MEVAREDLETEHTYTYVEIEYLLCGFVKHIWFLKPVQVTSKMIYNKVRPRFLLGTWESARDLQASVAGAQVGCACGWLPL